MAHWTCQCQNHKKIAKTKKCINSEQHKRLLWENVNKSNYAKCSQCRCRGDYLARRCLCWWCYEYGACVAARSKRSLVGLASVYAFTDKWLVIFRNGFEIARLIAGCHRECAALIHALSWVDLSRIALCQWVCWRAQIIKANSQPTINNRQAVAATVDSWQHTSV